MAIFSPSILIVHVSLEENIFSFNQDLHLTHNFHCFSLDNDVIGIQHNLLSLDDDLIG